MACFLTRLRELTEPVVRAGIERGHDRLLLVSGLDIVIGIGRKYLYNTLNIFSLKETTSISAPHARKKFSRCIVTGLG